MRRYSNKAEHEGRPRQTSYNSGRQSNREERSRRHETTTGQERPPSQSPPHLEHDDTPRYQAQPPESPERDRPRAGSNYVVTSIAGHTTRRHLSSTRDRSSHQQNRTEHVSSTTDLRPQEGVMRRGRGSFVDNDRSPTLKRESERREEPQNPRSSMRTMDTLDRSRQHQPYELPSESAIDDVDIEDEVQSVDLNDRHTRPPRRTSAMPYAQPPRGPATSVQWSDLPSAPRPMMSAAGSVPTPDPSVSHTHAPAAGGRQSFLPNLASPFQGFAAIAVDNFAEILTFAVNNSSVLSGPLGPLQLAAMECYKNDADQLGDQIVDRLVLLNHCKELSFDSSFRYMNELKELKQVSSLKNVGSQSRAKLLKHRQNFKTVQQALKPKASQIAPGATEASLRRGTQSLPQPSQGTGAMMSTSNPQDPGGQQFTYKPAGVMLSMKTGSSPQNVSNLSYGFPSPDGGLSNVQESMGSLSISNTSTDQPWVRENPSFAPGSDNPYRPATATSMSTFTHLGSASAMSYPTRPPAERAPSTMGDNASSLRRRNADFKYGNTRPPKGDDGNYAPRKNDARNFFERGRIFRMWWYEPAGRQSVTEGANFSYASNGARIYSKLLWMVVIMQRRGYCICSPISTYSAQGLKKPGLGENEIRAHAIIYSEGQSPTRLFGEPATSKDPIKVKMIGDREPMDKASRVHFGKVHTVNWDASIEPMGRVVAEHRDKLYEYFAMEYTRNQS